MAEQHGKALVPEIRFSGFTDPWEQRKLGELYQKNDERNTDGLGSERTLSVASMTFNSTGNGADESSLPNYKRLRLGDIAFEGHANKEFSYGRFVLNDAGNGIMSPRFTCLRPIAEQEYSFWKYFIHSEEVMRPILVNSTKSGTMMNELVVKDFLEQEILVPSLPEQRRIGAFFDRLNSLITLHQRKYDKLCVLKKSMLDKMFPKGGSLYPEIRFFGFTDPWEQRKLGEFDIKTGPFGSTLHAEDYVACGTPIVTTEHFKEGELPSMGNGIPQVGDRDAARLSQYKLQKHDIVFSRVGSVDLNAEVKDAQVGWLFSGRVLRLRTDRGINSTYLHYELGTVRVRSSIIERAVGLTMASINTRILGDTAFFVPATITEQRQIGAFFERLDSLITLHQRKLELLRNIKKSMLDKMFV